MDTRRMTPASLANSVIAVPPLARDSNLELNVAENVRQIRHLEAGGVRTLLYGGNAALAHVSLREYPSLLKMLTESAGSDITVIPSVGPTFGMMMDQAAILREFSFPTAMLLPSRDGTTPAGIASGMKRFVDRIERPAVLYLKHEEMVDVGTVVQMFKDGLISWIKYAIVRKDTLNDPFLSGLIDAIGPTLIVSGMGEQPAAVHLRHFHLAGFTSGCVCIAPRLSTNMLRALQARDDETAERIRQQFVPLESLRDSINPVRVLHDAVSLCGVSQTGPITPFLSPTKESDQAAIKGAAEELLRLNSNL
ncbi:MULTISPECIES: dihydrodipicolinate synthase family protein [unclassified Schlesneria]|uniref:dihydrodipicolinate synthase family protein n=1 Tax=unclassified Schlesneria TaxID=2762017 RepID=UPI002EFA2F6C